VTRVAVLVPWRPGCPWRERAWEHIRARYEHVGVDVVTGTTDVPGFSRTQAILDARSRSTADVFVVADADVIPVDSLDERGQGAMWVGVDQALERGWSVPHGLLHRLSPDATEQLYAGADWRGLPLSTDNQQDSRPYRVHEGGTFLIVEASAFDEAPPDPRFVGWGQEDDAWAHALRTLIGRPWRGSADLVHCWHPAEPRRTRIVGNDANVRLLARYRHARTTSAMHALIEEARAA